MMTDEIHTLDLKIEAVSPLPKSQAAMAEGVMTSISGHARIIERKTETNIDNNSLTKM